MENNKIIKVNSYILILILFALSANLQSFAQSPEIWNTTGTWTAPAGVTSVNVECWGAGGNGGTGNKNHAGGGGGGGAYSYTANIPVTPGNDYIVNVGVGGAATLTDRDSWFIDNSTYILAKGGNDGNGAAGNGSGSGGNGGLDSDGVGDTRYSGGNGAAGNSGTDEGGGGGSSASGSGTGVNATDINGATAPSGGGNGGNGGAAANGNNGIAPGGGAGGSGARNNGTGGTGASGQVVLTYTAAPSSNCPSITDVTPNTTQIKCVDDGGDLLTAAITLSGGSGTPTEKYEWYYNNTTDSNDPLHTDAVAVGVTTNTYTPSTASTGTGWYFCVGYADDNGCGQTNTTGIASNTVEVTVNDVPSTPTAITGNASPVEFTIETYSTSSTNADVNGFTWTFPTGWSGTSNTNSINLTAGAEGQNGDITVTASNACGNSAQTTLTVTPVASLGNPTITLGANPTICAGTTTADLPYSATTELPDEYSITYSAAALSEGFANITDVLAVAPNQISLIVPAAAAGGTYSGTLIVTNTSSGLSSGNYSFSVIVDGSPGDITGPAVVEANVAGYVYSISPVTNATGYSWSFPAGWNITSGSGTNSVTVTSGGLTNDGNVTVRASYASCGGFGDPSPPLAVEVQTVAEAKHSLLSCMSCHTFHHATGNALTNNAANAALCLSCHVTGQIGEGKPLLDTDKAVPGTSGNSHAWDVLAVNTTYQTNIPSNPEMAARLTAGDSIVCSTCHDQHNSAAAQPYLRMDNTDDAMCKDCHSARDVGTYIADNVNNRGSHPIGITYDETKAGYNLASASTLVTNNGETINCSTCHGVHDVNNSGALTTDGNLLKMTNDINLCTDCHNYPEHNGFDCLDCHEVHNTVDGKVGNNIFMIKDTVNGSAVTFLTESGTNSFVDKDGVFDGICEVCHTGTTHHLYDGSGITHNDATDKREQNCVGCHFHNVGFETPTGPQTCVSCHSSAQSGGRGGTVQIVGTGGEYDNTYPSRHTASGIGVDPDNAECEACHYDSDVTHPTSEMMLRDPHAAAIWTGGDVDLYCVECHDEDAPTTPVDMSYINTPIYNKSAFIGTPHDYIGGDVSSCAQCHYRHGSTNANLLKQASNYDGCNDCHNSTGDASSMSTDSWTSGGNSHAWNVNATNSTYDATPPTSSPMNTRMDGDNIVCSTCHDPHTNANTNFLVNDNSSDAMCKDCHAPRNLGRFTDDINTNIGHHPVGLAYTPGGDYVDPAPTLSSTQVGLVNGNIECSSCHSTHNATITDGSLLRETMTNATCKECHNYQPHQGFDCLDCHQSHNATNIMLVKDEIDIDATAGITLRSVIFSSQGTDASPAQALANSFSDGTGLNNGVCEVCHTTTAHHTGNVDDAHTHYDGQNCTGCHSHGDATASFPNGSCHGCHETTDPATDPNLYPLTGAHEAHCGDLYRYKCSECHFGLSDASPGHADGTPDVIFDPTGLASRFGLDTPVPTYNADKTCDNIYCHSSGQSADRGVVGSSYAGDEVYATTPAWDAAPGSISTCTPCHGGKGNMDPPYTITTSSPNEHLILSYDGIQTPTSGLHTHTAMFDDSDDCFTGPTGTGAVQCYLCHNTNGASCDETNYQGTYGAPQRLHVDGQTYYENAYHWEGGTWAPWQNNGKSIHDHCESKNNW